VKGKNEMAEITEQWLKENGFKWHDVERGGKHWLLWIGGAVTENRSFGRTSSFEDFGIELSKMRDGDSVWSLFYRADYAGRYSRFIFCRDVWETEHIEKMLEAITGFPYDKSCAMYGSYHRPEVAAYYRELDEKRLDRQIALRGTWTTDEKDDTKAVRK
jgi:hypothetical protein